jgi:hypothetical protein
MATLSIIGDTFVCVLSPATHVEMIPWRAIGVQP